MPNKKVKKHPKKRLSNTKLMFLSFLLLFIVFEALFILKAQTIKTPSEVAGVSTSK